MFTAEALTSLLAQSNVPHPAEFPERAVVHLTEVYRWNRVHDLTAVPESQALMRHTLDSVLPFAGLPPPRTLLDIGSGAGFPGLVLALYWPSTRVTLCEPLRKRRSFLDTVCARLGLTTELLEEPVEGIHGRTWDLVTSRATLPWAVLARSAWAVTAPGGELWGLCGPEQAPLAEDLQALSGWINPTRQDYRLPDGAGRCLVKAQKPAT